MSHTPVRQFVRWLFVEPRHVWLCLIVCALAFAVVLSPNAGERAIRLAGLALQLAGIVTVVWGIVETRQFFKIQSPATTVARWFARFPWRKRPAIIGIMAATLEGDTLSARAHTSWPGDPSLPIEERILRLEKNVSLIHERITNFQSQFDVMTSNQSAQLKRESSERSSLSDHLNTRIRAHGTGGLHISAIGAVWLLLGAIFGTASQELATWLK